MLVGDAVHLPVLNSSSDATLCTLQGWEKRCARERGQSGLDGDWDIGAAQWNQMRTLCEELRVGERDEAKQRHVLSLEEWCWITGVYAKVECPEPIREPGCTPWQGAKQLGSTGCGWPCAAESPSWLRRLDADRAFDRARQAAGDPPDFVLRFRVYSYWRQRQWIVKNGLKFGADYLLYERPPEASHARYALLIVRPWQSTRWRDINGLVRLAVGVAKKVIVAVPIPTSSKEKVTVDQHGCDVAGEALLEAGDEFREALTDASLQDALRLPVRFLQLSRGGALR